MLEALSLGCFNRGFIREVRGYRDLDVIEEGFVVFVGMEGLGVSFGL